MVKRRVNAVGAVGAGGSWYHSGKGVVVELLWLLVFETALCVNFGMLLWCWF
ncbi:hypothetical protein [Candidatus Borreliella tachyglossi]|uniref:hypothetical protein n=1 Tax=Candidatus Borreliella tachyglossi TaxID=1964448 RepID=UPI00131ED7AE|nr:hypothetical protein [Candidatus Borreliella tachyglossi]